jgi:hypothetical protein
MGCIQASHRLSDCLITGLFCYRPLSIFTRCARKAAQLFAADRLDFFSPPRMRVRMPICGLQTVGEKVEYMDGKLTGAKKLDKSGIAIIQKRALVDSVSSVCLRGQNFFGKH